MLLFEVFEDIGVFESIASKAITSWSNPDGRRKCQFVQKNFRKQKLKAKSMTNVLFKFWRRSVPPCSLIFSAYTSNLALCLSSQCTSGCAFEIFVGSAAVFYLGWCKLKSHTKIVGAFTLNGNSSLSTVYLGACRGSLLDSVMEESTQERCFSL